MAKSETPRFHLTKPLIIVLSGSLILLILLVLSFFIIFLNRYYPGVYVGDINLSAKTPDQAQQEVRTTLSQRENQILSFKDKGQSFQINLASLGALDNTNSKLDEAFSFGHSKAYFQPVHLTLVDSVTGINQQIQAISQAIDKPAIDASLQVNGNQIIVSPSQDGLVLDQAKLSQEILNYINYGTQPPSDLPLVTDHPKLTYNQLLEIKKELDAIQLSPIQLIYKDQSFNLDLPTILSLIDLNNTKSVVASANVMGKQVELNQVELNNNQEGEQISDLRLSLNLDKLKAYLNTLAPNINQSVKEPLFNFDQSANGGKGKVTEFQPPQIGLTLNIDQSAALINQRLVAADFSPITLVVDQTLPKNQLTNQLGIKELLAEGVSHFYHSIPNRIDNIKLAASKINGTLVPPGGIFSYNDTVGDISAATGFKEGYVIESGRTVLGDGGGVCQDSTTLFRAALKAGLPIVARTAHAYRVGYYEQDSPPGLDATVYAPSVDFKFKNDTPAYILIQAYTVNDDALYMDLYGTSDGRIATLTTPIITSSSPPLPDVRQDDPTLPKGTVQQVDFAASGANVYFRRTVIRDGQTLIHETYYSNYQPWANVYLVGTGA